MEKGKRRQNKSQFCFLSWKYSNLQKSLSFKAVPHEKIIGVFESKALYFCGVGCFSIQWVVVFCENVILLVVVLLKHAAMWVYVIQMGSCRLFGFKFKEE